MAGVAQVLRYSPEVDLGPLCSLTHTLATKHHVSISEGNAQTVRRPL